ncbi:L,D-peptidoglycan transpeptidase YkuD, ErfK/YbiS/YcfS/YnhG family [Actinacidiphila rubida]|uniref:L,D-peptidoglycan transpeptidase YkuD, ErfK/YbiS/YcfS/YnhG family n=1 Tax=Actinacidiphila rubida TaxID=310780 RepID=A0A1H8KVQ5_9ACTN|nr:L,D-transpeptidase family protein [Actinacidiphila rubida]SEN96939.1 L,D-peptidoglycan transpeptidase YkuD, ErfK/YbiS/YcfS/YnhG family [Actinacidiphila rubida]
MTSTPTESLDQSDTDPSRGRRRHRRPRRTAARKGVIVAAAGAVGLAALGTGYVLLGRQGGLAAAADTRVHQPAPAAPVPTRANAPAGPGTLGVRDTLPLSIAGLGPKTRAAIPAGSTQVLVASGKAKNSSDTVVTLWTRTKDGHWHAGTPWPAHNALHGWTATHHAGDLHSPIGVFTLHDAGGFDADPGSKLPYHHSSKFQAGGVGFDGEPLDDAFDYVIAIDYNRVPGTSPLDSTQPMGEDRGGGIWVHVDHGGPTHGCVSVSAAHMVELLHTLTPAGHPVIVMGDRASLAS